VLLWCGLRGDAAPAIAMPGFVPLPEGWRPDPGVEPRLLGFAHSSVDDDADDGHFTWASPLKFAARVARFVDSACRSL
jgi:hypothetical protein